MAPDVFLTSCTEEIKPEDVLKYFEGKSAQQPVLVSYRISIWQLTNRQQNQGSFSAGMKPTQQKQHRNQRPPARTAAMAKTQADGPVLSRQAFCRLTMPGDFSVRR